ncbi:hypothetical protein [Micromonospora aurantiaca (nom. illeg.)]|uniref:hypothetical protein n=1 Tax=Micromonospora aurantiaca (nom. illeg.) TaxID=47850 RepID=UPI003EBC8C86
MSLKRFGGWEPVTVTEYEYDGGGRLLRSWSHPETEWDQTQQAWMEALAIYRSRLCPLHGGPLEECTSPEDTGVQFEVDRSTCRAQLTLIEAQRAVNDGKKPSPYAGARLWTLRKRG